MSDKDTHKEKEEEVKEGELNVDVLDAAFDDHGFGEEEVPVLESKGVDDEEDDGGAEWRTDDDNKDW